MKTVSTDQRNKKGQRNSRRRRSLIWIAALAVMAVIAVSLGIWHVAERRHHASLQKAYAGRVQAAREVLADEKAWIRNNQTEAGAIRLYDTEDGEGSVTPYFSCQAVLGLLAGKAGQEDLDAALRYLSWHTERLLQENGRISNYEIHGGRLTSTGEQDSVDAYVALYVTALSQYVEKGGSLSEIPGAREALILCAGTLEDLLFQGLTCVSEENGTRYLMDNAEVLEACRAALKIPEVQESKSLRERYTAIGNSVKAGIREQLWDPETGVYAVGLEEDGDRIPFAGWGELYPDALAQIFPLICGAGSPDDGSSEALYGAFCRAFRWERLKMGDSDSAWACTAYAAVMAGDYARAETYLSEFSACYRENRKYPFHVAESGWAARTAGQLLQYYEKQQQKSLWDTLTGKPDHAGEGD